MTIESIPVIVINPPAHFLGIRLAVRQTVVSRRGAWIVLVLVWSRYIQLHRRQTCQLRGIAMSTLRLIRRIGVRLCPRMFSCSLATPKRKDRMLLTVGRQFTIIHKRLHWDDEEIHKRWHHLIVKNSTKLFY